MMDGSNTQHGYGRGITLMLVALVSWVIMNAAAKALTSDFHALQILFFRNFLTILIFGLGALPLSEVISITYAAPLFMTALSVPFLGEKVGLRRWIAISIGFVGMLIIVRPEGEVNPMSLLVLAGVLSFAMTVIKTRQLSLTDAAATIVFYSVVSASIVTGASLFWVWTQPQPLDWVLFITVGLFGALSQITITMAIRAAPISVLAPLDYLTLVFGVAIDFMVWGILPEPTTFYGAGIIVTVGIYIIYRDAGGAIRNMVWGWFGKSLTK
jgi:drug/metabolite transporter (DMT)-like permease